MSVYARKKLYYLLVLILVSLAMYIGIKYILPVMWPFLVAFGIAVYLNKCVKFLNKRLKINSKIATFLVIAGVFIFLVGILIVLFGKIVEQIKVLVENFDTYVCCLENGIKTVCDKLGECFGFDTTKFHDTVQIKMYGIVDRCTDTFMDNFMVNTKEIAAGTMNFIILLVLLFTAIIYMTKDMDRIKHFLNDCYFSGEVAFVKNVIKTVFFAYLKTQLILICIISVICVVGLYIMRNPYSLGLGILIGVLDALPLFGVGTVLLPWTLAELLMGKYVYAAMLFTIFVLAYMVREYLEPKIMGNTIGIHPVISLIAVYVGYTLFGFLGMMIGPFTFLIIFEIMKKVEEKDG